MSTATAPKLLTAEEYAVLDVDHPTELVRGVVVHMPPPRSRHGQVCSKVVMLVGNHCHEHSLGHILSNDAGIITERGPDTVRGGDVSFYDYHRVPKGKLPTGYLSVSPDLVFEVLSPDDRWSKVLRKVTEYLLAGVKAVCVLDPKDETLRIYRDDQPEVVLGAEDEFTIPEILSGFSCRVGKFFE
jgi:Uma2 family endonuclease